MYFRSVLKQRFTFYPHDCFFAHQHYWVSFHHDFQPRVFCHHQRVFYRTKWFFSWTTVVVFLIWIYLTHVFDSRSLFSFFYWMNSPVSLWFFFLCFFLLRHFYFCFGYFCIFDSTFAGFFGLAPVVVGLWRCFFCNPGRLAPRSRRSWWWQTEIQNHSSHTRRDPWCAGCVRNWHLCGRGENMIGQSVISVVRSTLTITTSTNEYNMYHHKQF